MATDYNDQFEKWKNGNNAAQTGKEDLINEESHESNEAVEQVSRDLFGFTEIQQDNERKEESDSEFNDTGEINGGTQKTSFAELRQGKKVPRLKKTMVLAIIAGGTFMFLFVINIFLQENDGKKQYFEEQKNSVAIGNDFSIRDLVKRPMSAENDKFQTVESAEFYLRTPPPYEPVPVQQAAPVSQGGNVHHSVYNSAGNYSDSDLLAMKTQIGKDGGYGFVAQSAYYSQPSNEFTGTQIPAREEYIKQSIDEIARLTQATGNSGWAASDRTNNGRYSDSGNYNPDNTQAGSGIAYLNDNCLFPGTIIHAILVSRIDTDYPGPIHARVTENVYDSMTGKNLLIPQGTILQGNYSSSSIGVAKVQIAWESMVVNYSGVAYQVSLGGMAGVDKRGRAGISGMLDDHYFEWLKAAGIISLFSMLNSEVAYQTKNQSSPQVRELMDINQGIVNNLGDKLMDRALDIQPTVRVANGTAVSVSVNTPVILRPFSAIQAEEKYTRR